MHIVQTLSGTGEEETELEAVLEALRAGDGRLLRALLRTLSRDDSADARRLAEVLVHHPKLRDLIAH
jgi:hypothetical protein